MPTLDDMARNRHPSCCGRLPGKPLNYVNVLWHIPIQIKHSDQLARLVPLYKSSSWPVRKVASAAICRSLFLWKHKTHCGVSESESPSRYPKTSGKYSPRASASRLWAVAQKSFRKTAYHLWNLITFARPSFVSLGMSTFDGAILSKRISPSAAS